MARVSMRYKVRHAALTMTLQVRIPKPRFVERTAAVIQERFLQGQKSSASPTIINTDHAKTPTVAKGGGAGAAFRSAWQWIQPSSPGPGQQSGWWAGNKRRDEEFGL